NVIGRGMIGHLHGSLVVASPLYKQHFRLQDGQCLEQPELSLTVWPVRLTGDQVEILAPDSASASNSLFKASFPCPTSFPVSSSPRWWTPARPVCSCPPAIP